MKRLEEKVRDIVEVRSSPGLGDFLADPAETLKGFHFTDITADLMSKWIGQIADVKKGRGVAFALAGFRGVGKSHFLAALSAIVSQPELRAKITDTHVMSTAQRLSRRHGVVAHLKRGSSDSLLSELKIAIAEVTGAVPSGLSDSLNEILLSGAEKSGDIPLVLLIDTAFGREASVARDDGALLSEIAAAAVVHGLFVGIALDDDIASADGLNSSIASNFAIDYLDQEHLYKIVDTHVFPKREHGRHVLHEIYGSYRNALPGFRWSEHRFSCLYPMHPAILELAPFVRLYLQDFALIRFAVEAGLRILGRPANSLIGLDEVFDSIEMRLRGVKDLKDAFAAYDSLDRTIVAKIPVMKRHEAKLILKGLFLLSFNGDGVTATEVAAAMLIFNEADPTAGVALVSTMLRAFSDALPDSIKKTESSDREAKFGFKVGRGDDLNSVLADAIKKIPSDTVELVLRRQTADKFSEFDISDDGSSIWATSHVVWRGGIRPGEIIWQAGGRPGPDADDKSGDWKVLVRYGTPLEPENETYEWPACEWKLGKLSSADIDTFLRFHVLQTNNELRESFRESIPTVLQVHSIAVEKIWQRVFFEESRLIVGEDEYGFTESARSAHSLSELFTIMLQDQLEKQFPSHPDFQQLLGDKQVSLITEQLFSGAGTTDPEIQRLAANFALPLGLVNETDNGYAALSAADLAELRIVKEAFAGSDPEEGVVTPISDLSAGMGRAPNGLTREAQHLVLAALVAQRQFEFVTSNGNRISHRSLDLQIDWEDIVGIARPSGDAYSGDRLIFWASLLTGDNSLRTLKASEARTRLADVFSTWFSEWQKAELLQLFDLLPDENLNSKLWRVASNVKKTFGVVSESIESLLQGSVALDKCLQTIADVFADSEEEFESKHRDLAALGAFISRSVERDEISKYLAQCGSTGDLEIDGLRSSLMESITDKYVDGQTDDAAFRDRWMRFRTSYTDLYADKHDSATGIGSERRKLDRFLSTDTWAMFAALSEISWFGRYDMEKAMAIIRQARTSECDIDVRKLLAVQPFCDCSFRLKDAAESASLVDKLAYTVGQGMDYFRHKLLAQKVQFSAALHEVLQDRDTPSKLSELASFLETNSDFPMLSAQEIYMIRIATRDLDMPNALHSDRRRSTFETFVGFNPAELRSLEDEMQSLPDLSLLSR